MNVSLRRFRRRRQRRALLRALSSWVSGDLESLLESILWVMPGWPRRRVTQWLLAFLLRTLSKRNPSIVDFRRFLASFLLIEDRFDEAAAACDEALAELASMRWPVSPATVRVERRFRRGRYSNRNMEVVAILLQFPERVRGELWGLRGRAELLRGDPEAALEAWERELRSEDPSKRPLLVSGYRKVLETARLCGDPLTAELTDGFRNSWPR